MLQVRQTNSWRFSIDEFKNWELVETIASSLKYDWASLKDLEAWTKEFNDKWKATYNIVSFLNDKYNEKFFPEENEDNNNFDEDISTKSILDTSKMHFYAVRNWEETFIYFWREGYQNAKSFVEAIENWADAAEADNLYSINTKDFLDEIEWSNAYVVDTSEEAWNDLSDSSSIIYEVKNKNRLLKYLSEWRDNDWIWYDLEWEELWTLEVIDNQLRNEIYKEKLEFSIDVVFDSEEDSDEMAKQINELAKSKKKVWIQVNFKIQENWFDWEEIHFTVQWDSYSICYKASEEFVNLVYWPEDDSRDSNSFYITWE